MRMVKLLITDLVAGKKYYILEKESATGYVITDEKVTFEITEDGEVVKAEMKNKPITGTLRIYKSRSINRNTTTRYSN